MVDLKDLNKHKISYKIPTLYDRYKNYSNIL